jgi:YidC/Oxa1 family membrane protein insertase
MNFYAIGPIAAVLDAAYAVLHNLTLFLTPFAAANAAALAIVVITLALRVLLVPVGVSQARAQRVRQRLAPRLAELRRLHGSSPERLQRETAALYASEHTHPDEEAGCLPLLVQAPILSIVYGLFVLADINGHDNALLAGGLFGSPLGTSILTGWGTGQDLAVLLVGVGVLAALLLAQLLSRRLMLAQGAPAAGPRALSWLPLISVVFAAFVPLAAALYLTVSALWSVSERALLWRMLRPGGEPTRTP